ncbi:MAG: MarR family winged helix-turn-helix transcriptional regulator [bacterium]
MAKFNLQKSPGHLLRRAQQYSYDLYAKGVGKGGPTPRQFAVLHTVSENEGLSQTDLVRATGIDRSTLADMISRLIKKGYLARQRTKADARANSVKLTATGKRVLSSATAKVMKAETASLGVLPKSQQAAFMKALATYAEALDKIEAEEMAPKKRKPRKATKKKAAKKKVAKKKATKKKATKKKATKKKVVKKKAAPKKAAKKKVVKKKATKKKAAPKKAVKKTTRKVAKKTTKKVAKKKPAAKKATRKVTKRRATKKK